MQATDRVKLACPVQLLGRPQIDEGQRGSFRKRHRGSCSPLDLPTTTHGECSVVSRQGPGNSKGRRHLPSPVSGGGSSGEVVREQKRARLIGPWPLTINSTRSSTMSSYTECWVEVLACRGAGWLRSKFAALCSAGSCRTAPGGYSCRAHRARGDGAHGHL